MLCEYMLREYRLREYTFCKCTNTFLYANYCTGCFLVLCFVSICFMSIRIVSIHFVNTQIRFCTLILYWSLLSIVLVVSVSKILCWFFLSTVLVDFVRKLLYWSFLSTVLIISVQSQPVKNGGWFFLYNLNQSKMNEKKFLMVGSLSEKKTFCIILNHFKPPIKVSCFSVE
jgi:hypothetical protein